MPKFDYVIQNPPYSRSLHLKFLELALNILEQTQGIFCVIEPSTWLIQLQPNGSYRGPNTLATQLRNRIDGKVEEVIIENYNDEFDTNLSMPFSIVKGNLSKHFDKIKFSSCGEISNVDSIHDCNLVGRWETIFSIFEKLKKKFGKNTFEKRFYKEGMEVPEGTVFAAVAKVMRGGCGDPRFSNEWFIDGLYRCYYYHCYNDKEEISETPHKLLCTGYNYDNPKYKDAIALNIWGTKEELENWKYFVYNNNLCKFLNICIVQDMNDDNINKYVPFINWKYTTEEIYKDIDLSKQEIELIETTIKRYSKASRWFRRYLEGNISKQ